MAAYVTAQELTRLGIARAALTGVQTSDLQFALEAASRVADSYLTTKFVLPLTAWGDDLKQKVADIAAYNVMKVRGFDPQKGDAETLRDSFEDAMSWLKDVATGKARPTGVVDSSPGGENNTDAAGESRQAPMVLQAYPDQSSESEDFWGSSGSSSSGTTGTPRRRGW